ncbi:hypothetical protein EDB89DRAFT_1884464 [Lactarius sanguifluus]|nr:hypothetical protein EDB89DRAFT_1884464 [Lactarius sanguifluus]
MDESREEIPRISIDSLRDWHRMKSNFSNAVFELFDQRIRQNGLESERASFLPHLQQFINTTFEKAEPNVRINGKNFEEVKDGDDEVEPFDEALDRETWSLYNERLQCDLELATKRRKRPQEVANLLENLFKAQEAAMGEFDEPAEEEEDHLDPSLPDGKLVVRLAWLVVDIGQKLCLQRRRTRSLMWLASLRVYLRWARFYFMAGSNPDATLRDTCRL